MASRRAFLGSRILALILVSICLVNWDFNSNLSFLELDQVCMLARYHPHRSFNFFDFDFHTLVEERRHFGSSFYRGGGYLSFRISLYPNSVSTFQLNRLIISGDISENPGPDKCSVRTLSPKTIVLSPVIRVLDSVILSAEKLNQMTTRNYSWLMTLPGFALPAYLNRH